jgi:hypothetical protein
MILDSMVMAEVLSQGLSCPTFISIHELKVFTTRVAAGENLHGN